ncbi:polysaccharide biosynthesis protein [Listeria weihenstephanensis]|uniref:Polysaccharide biosynthesis protein n=1 Tax=Listeria weihenstephanensis TaxID=1006155 RepID=A0A841ZAH7_9LIST|nr:polysaccharide biosynthesis protein [Listeria weihenstephanensis]MBC1501869.1 polysaccharide biosynthesis protein [Listeria weihenstephanensis]
MSQYEKRTLLLGAGEASQLLIPYFHTNKTRNLKLIGLLDDRMDIQYVEGLPILGGLKDIGQIVTDYAVEYLVLAIPSLKGHKKIEVLEACSKAGVQTEIMPDIGAIIRGEGSIQAMEKLDYKDLLDREEATLDYDKLKIDFFQKKVLITGAGGSIGSEIVRQLIRCEPAEILLVGHGENSIFNILQEMTRLTEIPLIPIIADIQDKHRLEEVFEDYRPDIVYHAAAHKHVPMMEVNIREAVKNNIMGTKNLVDVSEYYDVERFIMISTDKSVEPTSVMGATKKIAEWIVQAKNDRPNVGVYSVVRFGNVLGSRGSAIPLFWEQIKSDQTITITHPDMERYFMTIPEASQLVIEAGMLAMGGEVFILKMGDSQKIVDIVYKLAVLAGKRKEQLDIQFIGLRDGEKIREELFEIEEIETASDTFMKFYCGQSKVPNRIYEIEDWNQFFAWKSEKDIRKELLQIASEKIKLTKEPI